MGYTTPTGGCSITSIWLQVNNHCTVDFSSFGGKAARPSPTNSSCINWQSLCCMYQYKLNLWSYHYMAQQVAGTIPRLHITQLSSKFPAVARWPLIALNYYRWLPTHSSLTDLKNTSAAQIKHLCSRMVALKTILLMLCKLFLHCCLRLRQRGFSLSCCKGAWDLTAIAMFVATDL